LGANLPETEKERPTKYFSNFMMHCLDLHLKSPSRGFKFKDFEHFPIPQMLSSSMEEVVLQSKARKGDILIFFYHKIAGRLWKHSFETQ